MSNEKRMTIEIGDYGAAFVRLDGKVVATFSRYEDTAKNVANAESYVEGLIKHFREGGR